MLNKLLEQQIQNYLGETDSLPDAFKTFFKTIGESYDLYDKQKNLLENSVSDCAGELRKLNEKLQHETARLNNAHQELSKFFDQVNEGFFTRDILKDKYIHMSVGCEKIYGYTVKDFYSNNQLWYQVIHPDDKKIIDGESISLNNGIQINSTYRIIHKGGSTRWIEVKAIPVLKNGNLIKVDGVVNDITERKVAEILLMESEVKYRSFYEFNMDGILLSDPGNAILEANPAACKLFNATEQEICALSVSQILNFGGPQLKIMLEERNRTGKFTGELNIVLRDGTPISIDLSSGLFKDANNTERSFIIVKNITERKRAEAMLRESEEKYRMIVETAQEGIWMMDEHYHTIFVNKKMCELSGYTEDEMLGKHITYFLEHEESKLVAPSMKRWRIGISENFDLPIITKSGNHIWTNISTSAILNNEGKFIGELAMVTDINKRKLDEERIKKSEAILDLKNKELKRKNTELEQFAYVASHDLQEPLRTSDSFVKLLQKLYEGRLDERADKYLNFIVDSSQRMQTLVKDLLDYSRIGAMHELAQVDCNKIMKDVIADLDKAITESTAIIIVHDLPVISGYSTEIKQLFQNLLINAIKFRKQGAVPQIEVMAKLTNENWIFSISDNGIGIEKSYNERIFIIFQRLHNRSEYQGSGIGLSHCKKIVELHHGKIWVDSLVGIGSTFYFSIPVFNPLKKIIYQSE